MAVKISTISALIVFLALLSLSHFSKGELRLGFYNKTCPNVEQIVFEAVQNAYSTNPRLAPLMLRLYFHDCFSNGCDASLLLDLDGTTNEKMAPPNLTVDGYGLIDTVKEVVEKNCTGVVSCADIIALVTRDLVYLASGKKARYEIPTGRYDGRESLASTVELPGPRMSVSDTFEMFKQKNLSLTDMVLLLGGHTIGVAHCSFIVDRLYYFENGEPDPTMDRSLVEELRKQCPKDSVEQVINLDQDFLSSSSNIIDASFYMQILTNRGIFQMDQLLATDVRTTEIVVGLATGNDFLARFGQAMVNLGSVRVKDENTGEIRKSCRFCKKRFCRK